MRCVCITNEATSTANGSRRRSPSAIDQHRNSNSRKGTSDAHGFQTSVSTTIPTERTNSTMPTAVATAKPVPARRRASSTTPTRSTALNSAMKAVSVHVGPTRAGTESSQ